MAEHALLHLIQTIEIKVFTTSEEDCSILKLLGDLEIGYLRSGGQY